MPLNHPIPSFYCVYVLRSTIRHSSLYIGSTPNPVRRLNQHNGIVKGGAVKTSKESLRPWEMACIVTGFPSNIAALQFEWAFQNPHLTLHIPPASRLSQPTAKKRNGQPKRPSYSLRSLLSNLHLLLRVPSFRRLPLCVRFLAKDVYKVWMRYCKESGVELPAELAVIADYEPEKIKPRNQDVGVGDGELRGKRDHGIAALDVPYEAQKSHVEKAKAIFDFEREGCCSVCKDDLLHAKGKMLAVCPNENCEAVSHLLCLGKRFLGEEQGRVRGEAEGQGENVVPISGTCPRCKKVLRWVDVVMELTLRIRGPKVLEKLLTRKRIRKGDKESAASSGSDDQTSSNVDEPVVKKRRRTTKALKSIIPLSDTNERSANDNPLRSEGGKANSLVPTKQMSTPTTSSTVGSLRLANLESSTEDILSGNPKQGKRFNGLLPHALNAEPGLEDSWYEIYSSEDSDVGSVVSQSRQLDAERGDKRKLVLPMVIEDSEDEWEGDNEVVVFG